MRLPFSSPAHNTISLPKWCLLIIGIPLVAFGQQPGTTDSIQDKGTLQALLTEVRQLRLALERSTSVVPRIQLAFQRLQLQQDRVDRLSKQLQDSHKQTAATGVGKARVVASIQQLEVRISQEQDPTRHRALESEW